jgi:hypothetical protein
MLTSGGSKMLRYMLEQPEGCDAWLTHEQFVVQYGWHLSHHHYDRGVGVEALAWLRRRVAGSSGVVAAGAFPMIDKFPSWHFGARAVWIADEPERTAILIREATSPELPAAPPPPIEPAPVYIAGAQACPHCRAVPERYRVLRDGAHVCLACGASSPRPA